MEKKTNLDMLLWGIKHIAENHGLKVNTDYEEEGRICIYGGCNVPTLADVQLLCGDVGIDERYIYASREGVDVELPRDWFDAKSNEEYVGLGFWQRREQVMKKETIDYSKDYKTYVELVVNIRRACISNIRTHMDNLNTTELEVGGRSL